tara:strand:- start:3825 stop:4811 length:987 start_codon:yes stop_codon:yes gene_type:complete
MLTLNELRRLVKKHNQLMDIIIPPKTNRDALIKLIEKNGFTVDHDKKKIVPKVQMKRKPTVPLPPAPPKKTEEEKKVAKAKKVERDTKRDKVGYDKELQKRVEAVKKARASKPKPAPTKKSTTPVPKGSHKMPDGSIMKDKEMPKKKVGNMKIKIVDSAKKVKEAGKVKIWNGDSGKLPDGSTTNNDVLFETAWKKEGFKVRNDKKPMFSMPVTVSQPTKIPGKRAQYNMDSNRGVGNMTLSQLNIYLKARGFGVLSGEALKLFNDNVGDDGWSVMINIPLQGGQKVGKNKTLQPPFQDGFISITLRKKGKREEGSTFNLRYVKYKKQ